MSKEFKEKVREHFKDVDEKDFEQKVRAFNGLDNQKYNPISVSIGTALFEHYKADYLKQINRPFSNKKAIIISFKNKVEKLLRKYTETHSQIILGKLPIFFTDDIFEKYWYFTLKHWVIEIMKFQKYLSEEENFNEPLQQPQVDKPDEVKKELHNHIFRNNAFEVWQSMYDNFNINETKRTDLRFMYEVMKYNKQIHKTVTLKTITDWINETYQFSIKKLQYTYIKSKSNENRMSIYNLIK